MHCICASEVSTGLTLKAGRARGLLVSHCVTSVRQVQSHQARCYAKPGLRLSSPAGNAVLPNATCCRHCYRGNCAEMEWSWRLRELWRLLSLQVEVCIYWMYMYCRTSVRSARELRSPRYTYRWPSKHEVTPQISAGRLPAVRGSSCSTVEVVAGVRCSRDFPS